MIYASSPGLWIAGYASGIKEKYRFHLISEVTLRSVAKR
jgi:hypothetical protein